MDADIDPRRADARTDGWKVKFETDEMWIDTRLEPRFEHGETFWVASGEFGASLGGVRGYGADGQPFHTVRLDDRRFEVVMNTEDVLRVISGGRIFLDFVTADFRMLHGSIVFAPRFARWDGTPRIFVYRAINPVYVGSELRFRGRAKVDDGHELEVIYTDDDAGPVQHEEEPGKYRFDWTPHALLLAADPPSDPVHFRVHDGADRRVEKTAGIDLRLVTLGLTTKNPLDAWPAPTCTTEMRECLEGLEPTEDTESCGWANQVEACLGEGVYEPDGATPDRFIEDLREALRDWYGAHEDEVRARGGRTLESALEALETDDVGEVDNVEDGEHPGDYDPEYYDIFYHSDPVYRDSARIWYGAYEPSGRLEAIWAVN